MKVIDLKGKVAVVTGGTGQLGKTMVRELAKCGADVVIGFYTKDRTSQDLKEEIEKKHGVRAFCAYVDVTDYESVIKMKKSVNESLGLVDIVINNSVVQYEWTSVLEQDIDDYDSQFKSCVMQGVYMAKAFVPDMINKKCGKIINISSIWGIAGASCEVHYSTAKAAVIGLTKSLAKELGLSGININCVAPGIIATDMNKNISPEVLEELKAEIPLGYIGSPENIADAILFLASKKADYITGQILSVNGGFVI